MTLIQGDDGLTGVPGEFDFINTDIVLQHIPPARGLALIERLLTRLRPGGVAAMQLTYAKGRRFLEHEGRHARFYRRHDGMLVDVAPLPDELPEGTISMFDYDLNSVVAILSMYAGHPILMLPTNNDDHLSVNFVFRRGQ